MVRLMDTDTPIPRHAATGAQYALIPCLADLLERAADLCASADPADAAPKIISLCQDGAALAQAIAVINRRAAP